MAIPIRNIYYILSYAWDTLEQRDVVDVDALAGTNWADLCAHVLVGGARRLIKEGLRQSYFDQSDELAVLRGRVNFLQSARRQSFERGKAVCDFQELSKATMANRVLRTTLREVANVEGLDNDLRSDLLYLWRCLAEIPETRLSDQVFRSLARERHSPIYSFLLHVCELAHNSLLPTSSGQVRRFRGFFEDDERMPVLFQRFVFNFYNRECPAVEVKVDRLSWDAVPERQGDESLLPQMETDISLRSSAKTWIIDTKYYADCMRSRFSAPKLVSENLYQMFSYLKNIEKNGGNDASAEGILLYPFNGKTLDSAFRIAGHRVRFCTVDLSADWPLIRQRLLGFISSPGLAPASHPA